MLGMSVLNINVFENQLEIKRVVNKEKGAFKKYWDEEIIPFCTENNIKVITLTDTQTTDRDVWGEDYGFSGRFRSGTRVVYVGVETQNENTFIELLISLKANDMMDDDEYIEGMYDRLNLTKSIEHYINEYTKYYNSRLNKGKFIINQI